MRAAVYCRISSDRDDTQLGVKRQEKDCLELCAREGYEVTDLYVDNNRTAADPDKPRPEYERMMRAVEGGKADVVVVYREDRLHRQPAELEAFASRAKKAGLTRLHSVRSGSTDLTDAAALMTLRIKGDVAAYEVAVTKERILRKQQELAESGKSHGGGRRAFGWQRVAGERDGTVVCEEEAVLIREAAERVLRGETLRSIAMDWEGRGVPTSSGRPWRVNSVRSFLSSPRNAGLRTHRGVLTPADWPAILDRDTWDQLQAVFSDNSQRQPRSVKRAYPLTGVMVCGVCGKKLTSVPRKKPIPSDPDRRVRYYGCRRDLGACGKIFVTAEHVESVVFPAILRLVDDPATRALTSAERASEGAEIKALVQANAEDGTRLAELEDAFAAGDLTRAGLQRNAKAIKERIGERQSRISALSGNAALDRFGGDVAGHWDELSSADKRSVVLTLVTSIEVRPKGKGGFNTFDPGRLVFHWRLGALAQAVERWAEHATPDDIEGEHQRYQAALLDEAN